jgi:hypothetical protein
MLPTSRALDAKPLLRESEEGAAHQLIALANGVRISIWFLGITDKYIFNIVKHGCAFMVERSKENPMFVPNPRTRPK